MKITWEDRKSAGRIDNHHITEKPTFSFEYAWFLVDDDTAQYVESHEYGYWNKDMTPEQRQEVIDYYNPALFTRALIERSEGTGCWHCLSGFASSARVAVE